MLIPNNQNQSYVRGVTGAQAGTMASPPPTDRFRSFAERYIIARAASFRTGHELEDGWHAVQDAKKLYGMARDGADEINNAERQARQNYLEAVSQMAPTQSPPIKATPVYGQMVVRPPHENLTDDPGALLAHLKICQAAGHPPDSSMVQRFYELITGKSDGKKKA